MNDDHDRDAILLRRTLLVSSALAAFGCAGGAKDDGPETAGTGATPTGAPTGTGSAAAPPTADPTAQPSQPAKTWDQLIAEAPPRTIDPKLPERDRQQLQLHLKQFETVYGLLGAIVQKLPPACDLRQDACAGPWKEAAIKLFEADDAVPDSEFGLCGGPSEDTLNATITLRSEHRTFLRQLLTEVTAELDRVAATTGIMSEQVWLKMRTRPKNTMPMPCLSCMGPQFERISTPVPFEADKSTLTEPVLRTLASVPEQTKRFPLQRFEVRGHADAGEKNPDELSLERAKSVRDFLVSKGVDKKRLDVVAMAARFPVATGKTEAGRAKNRVVYLETIPGTATPARKP